MTKKPANPSAKKTVEFFEAINEGDLVVVVEMLEAGMHPDVVGRDRQSALFTAVVGNDYAIVDALLRAGAKPDYGGTNPRTRKDYAGPLHYACAHDRRGLIKLLLDKGANPATVSENGRTAAHELLCSCERAEAPSRLWQRSTQRTVGRMIDAGVSTITKDGQGFTLLSAALKHRCDTKLIQMLLNRQSVGEPLDPEMVFIAIWQQRADALGLLVKYGYNMNTPSRDGTMPLFKALDIPTCQAVIELGANLNYQDSYGNTVLHEQLRRYEKKPDKVSDRLLLLVEAGIDLTLQNKDGETALDMAKRANLGPHQVILASAAARQAMKRVSAKASRNSGRQP